MILEGTSAIVGVPGTPTATVHVRVVIGYLGSCREFLGPH